MVEEIATLLYVHLRATSLRASILPTMEATGSMKTIPACLAQTGLHFVYMALYLWGLESEHLSYTLHPRQAPHVCYPNSALTCVDLQLMSSLLPSSGAASQPHCITCGSGAPSGVLVQQHPQYLGTC